MLLPAEVDLISKKESGKWNLFWPNGSSNSKTVLILLAETVAFHVRHTVIEVTSFSLKFVSR